MEEENKKRTKEKTYINDELEKISSAESFTSEYICPNCKLYFVTDKKHGEIRCEKCGMILKQQIILLEKEWRTFGDDVSGIPRANDSAKESLWNKKPSTRVGIENIDAHGMPISTQTKIRQLRMSKLQSRGELANTEYRSFVLVLSKVDRILNILNIKGKIRCMKEEGAHIYKKLIEKHPTKRRNHQAMAAAIVYLLCKAYKIPFQFIDICKAADVTRRLTRKYIKDIQPIIKEIYCVNNARKSQNNISMRSAPADYLDKFADRWNLPPDVEAKAEEILKCAAKKGILSGMSPAGFAAAALYLAAKEKGIHVKLSLIKEVKYLTLKKKIKLLEGSMRGL